MPTFEPDFTTVYASTPVWPKALYRLEIDKVRGFAYMREDEKTGEKTLVRGVDLNPIIVGIIDSAGKLQKKDAAGAEITGQRVERIRLYIHSQGAMEFSKRILMAIWGYKREEEEKFNTFFKTLDHRLTIEEAEDGEGYDVEIGDGWEKLTGKQVDAHLSKGSFTTRDGAEVERQEFDAFLPVK